MTMSPDKERSATAERHVMVVQTKLGNTYLITNIRDEKLASNFLQVPNGAEHETRPGLRNWYGRTREKPYFPNWLKSTCTWQYIGDDIDGADMLELVQELPVFKQYTSYSQSEDIPEMLMHTPDSMAKFLRWKATQAGCEPGDIGSHITLSHLFGAEADSEQLLRTVLGLQDGTESLSMMSTFKKRKLANAADDEQQ
jgi:hypothetical protein